TMTYEAWDDKFKNNQDWNHAWGAAPANVIPRYVVGVTPLEPGYARMAIAPQTSSLKSVTATVPTIRGGVEVEINATEEAYSMRVVIPANTMAEVSLPAMRTVTELYVDGQPLEPCLIENDRIDCGIIGSGAHTFELRY
ncbi:MAG: alpha-L-rhamnosidase, partial [Alistipes sp.]|nr:alpha-L-rhamnosidase [Alistipes sp.]